MARRRKRSPPTQPQRRSVRVRKRTRRSRFVRLLHRLLCLFLIVGAGILTIMVFFKVDTVEVEGETRYAAEAIQQTLGIQKEDNLFFWSKKKAAKRLLTQYPYLDTVKIKRRIPDKLVIVVTESDVCAAIPSGSEYYLITNSGKILEKVSAEGLGDIPLVSGITLDGATVGTKLDASEQTNAQFLQLLFAMDDAGMLQEIQFINMEIPSDIRIGYLGRFDVRFGSLLNLQRKLQFLQTVIEERLSPSDTGVIDLTDVTRVRFQPGTQEPVAVGDDTAQQTQEEDTAETSDEDEETTDEDTVDSKQESTEE